LKLEKKEEVDMPNPNLLGAAWMASIASSQGDPIHTPRASPFWTSIWASITISCIQNINPMSSPSSIPPPVN